MSAILTTDEAPLETLDAEVSARVPKELKDEVLCLARAEMLSASDIVRRALLNYVRNGRGVELLTDANGNGRRARK